MFSLNFPFSSDKVLVLNLFTVIFTSSTGRLFFGFNTTPLMFCANVNNGQRNITISVFFKRDLFKGVWKIKITTNSLREVVFSDVFLIRILLNWL